MTTPRILLVRSTIRSILEWDLIFSRPHWILIEESELANVAERMSEIAPDILVIEIETQESSGLLLIKNIRMEAVIPILLLTSIKADEFLLEAYDFGVDDCILQPINPRLLRAKIKAWLRHSRSFPVGLLDPLHIGIIELIPADRTIIIKGAEPVHLSNLEFRMLYYLLGRRNHVMTTEELCQRVWLDSEGGDAMALKNVVYRLRKKIETDPHTPEYLRTVAGIGYEFVVQ